MPARRVYNRDDLYALVWSKPMREAAKDYSISDTALKKICRKLDVPTPPQGYWLRRAADRDAARAALPKLPDGASPDFYTVTYQVHDSISPSNAATERALAELTSRRIEVAPVLFEPHQLVARTTKLLAKAIPSDGLVSAHAGRGLDVAVAPANVERAMRIMDALLKAFADRELAVEITAASEGSVCGHTVHLGPITRVRVEDEWIAFSMSEALKVAPPPHDLPKQRTDMTWEERIKPRPRPERRARTTTGTLVLTIETGERSRHWRDRSRRKLELFLNDFIAHLYVVADWEKQHRKRVEAERRRQEEAERKRIEEARGAADEKRRIEDLHETLEQWRLARDLREFARSIRSVVDADSSSVTPGGPLDQYVTFVTSYADRIDPLREVRGKLRTRASL